MNNVFPGGTRPNSQTQPSRPVLKDKGNSPKECLKPRQRTPEQPDYRTSDIKTNIKKPCASKKLSLLRKPNPRRNSTGALEKPKMEPSKRNRLPLDSTWECNDSDSKKRTEASVISNESSIVASEGGSSISVGWSRIYPVLDDECNEDFPDALGLKSRSRSQDESGEHVEAGSNVLNVQHSSESSAANVEFLVSGQAPVEVVNAFSTTPDFTYFSYCDLKYPCQGKTTEMPASNYISTPIAGPRLKAKERLTPVTEVELECSASEATSASKGMVWNLKLGSDCETKCFPDHLQPGALVLKEHPPSTPGYRSFFATECMAIANQLESGCNAHHPSPLHAGILKFQRKSSVDVSTIDAEPLPFDSTPMRTILYNEAAKVVRSIETTPASMDHSLFGVSILDIDNLDIQLVDFVDGSYIGKKPSQECKDGPCAVSSTSCVTSGAFKGLKCLPSFEGIDVLKEEAESRFGISESENVSANRSLNCKVEMFVEAAPGAACGFMDGKLNATNTCSPTTCLSNAETVSVIGKQDQPSSESQNLNLHVPAVETVAKVSKTRDLFVTTLDIGTMSTNKKSEIQVFPILNTTQDLGQTNCSVVFERDSHLDANVANDPTNATYNLGQAFHREPSECDVHHGANDTQDIPGRNSINVTQDSLDGANTTRDIVDPKREQSLKANSTQDLGQSHKGVSESDVQLGANVTQDLMTNTAQEMGQTSCSSVSEGDVNHSSNVTQDLSGRNCMDATQSVDGANPTRDIVVAKLHESFKANTTQELGPTSHSALSEGDVQHGSNVTQEIITNIKQEMGQTSHSPLSAMDVQLGTNSTQDLTERNGISVTRESPDGSNATSDHVDAKQKPSFKANRTPDLEIVKSNGCSQIELNKNDAEFNKKNAELIDYLVKSDVNKGYTVVMEVTHTVGVVKEEDRQKEQTYLISETTGYEHVPRSDTTAITDLVLKEELTKCEANYCEDMAVIKNAPEGVVEPTKPTPQAVESGPFCSAGARSAEGAQIGLQKATDPMSSTESSVVESAESSRRSIGGEVSHNDSCFSLGSLSFVTSTPLPGAMPFQFSKDSRSDTMQKTTSLIIQSLSQSAGLVTDEPNCVVNESHQKNPKLSKSISQPSVCDITKSTNLPFPGHSNPKCLSRTEMSSRSGLPTARRALALASNEGSKNSRENVTKSLTVGRSIPTVSKTLRCLPTNSKTLLQKPAMLSTTAKAPGLSPTAVFDGNRTGLTLKGEQESKNKAPSTNLRQPHVIPHSKSSSKSPAVDKLPYKFTAQRGRPSLGGAHALESRLALRGTRTTESKLHVASVSKQMVGGPRSADSRTAFKTPPAPNSNTTQAANVTNECNMAVGLPDASENKRSLITPQTANGRTLQRGFRVPESRMPLGIARYAESRMSLGTPRLPDSKHGLGVQQTPTPRSNELRAPCSKLPMGAAGISDTGNTLVSKPPMGSNVSDNRSSQRGLRGLLSAERSNRTGIPRPPVENRRSAAGFGFRPASDSTSAMTKNGHLALKIPGSSRVKSPRSDSASYKPASDQTITEEVVSGLTNSRLSAIPETTQVKSSIQTVTKGLAVPGDNGNATKRKLSCLPALHSIKRSGLRQLAKIKIQLLNPSPKRQRLAAPDLHCMPNTSASSKRSPRSRLDTTHTKPAATEKPRIGLKSIHTTIRITEPILPGAEFIGPAVVTVEEFKHVPKSDCVTSVHLEELEDKVESMDLMHVTMECPSLESSNETHANVQSESSQEFPAAIEGSRTCSEFYLDISRSEAIHKRTPALEETRSDPSLYTMEECDYIQENSAMEELGSKSVHDTLSSTEEKRAWLESNQIPAFAVEQTTVSTHEKPPLIGESREGPDYGQDTSAGLQDPNVEMEWSYYTLGILEQKRLETKSNSRIPTAVECAWTECESKSAPTSPAVNKRRTESIYFTPPPLKKPCTVSQSFNQTSSGSKSMYFTPPTSKKPCTVSQSFNQTSSGSKSMYFTPPTSKKPCTVSQSFNQTSSGSKSMYFTPPTSKKPCTASQSFSRTPWTREAPRLGFLPIYKTPSSTAASFCRISSSRLECSAMPRLRGIAESLAHGTAPGTLSANHFLSTEKSWTARDTKISAPPSTNCPELEPASHSVVKNIFTRSSSISSDSMAVIEAVKLTTNESALNHPPISAKIPAPGDAHISAQGSKNVRPTAQTAEECAQTTFENHSPLQYVPSLRSPTTFWCW